MMAQDLYDELLESQQDNDDKFVYDILQYHKQVLQSLYIRKKITKFDLQHYCTKFANFIIQQMGGKN